MDALFSWLPLIGCAAMMLLVCAPMMKRMHKPSESDGDSATKREIAELREEIASLRAERAVAPQEEKTIRG
jgi:hypothetical protein